MIIAVSLIVAYWCWCYVHEMAHVMTAHWLVGVTGYELKLWPHRHQGAWRWAACRYALAHEATTGQKIAIHLAPRVPDLIAAVGFVLSARLLASGWLQTILLVLTGAGLVDLFVGSLGLASSTDLRLAANGLKISAWWLRAVGMIIVAGSAAAGIVGLFG